MIQAETPPDTIPHGKKREPRFGLRAPRDGSPAPFRVLISTRWLWSAGAILIAAIAGIMQLPRRWRLPILLGGGSVSGLAAFLTAITQARRLSFEHIAIPVAGLPKALDGFSIIQLSDFHLGHPFTAANLRRAVDWVHQRQPDLVVLTGDFVNLNETIPLLKQHLHGIGARHGVYAILGNHDYWTDIQAVERALTHNGVELLRNERRRIKVGDDSLYLVGVDCVWEAQHDLELALDGLPAGAPVVALVHEPDIADDVAAYHVTLQLSGHTHAGHFILPWLGPFFLPRHGFRYFQGLHRIGGMWLYVSRGLGGLPLRLGCPPEVTELTLRTAPPEA